jgi:hypothetical protein
MADPPEAAAAPLSDPLADLPDVAAAPPSDPPDVAPRLLEVVDRLERAAVTLRSGELAPEHAAHLVDECARLAAEAAAQLDRELRAVDPGSGAGQLSLDGA